MRLFVLLFALPAAVLLGQSSADALFQPPRIIDFHFQFRQIAWLDTLYQSHADGEYRPAVVEVDGQRYDSVGVRFKGTSSFYGYPGDKKSLRVKFNKYSNFTLYGLKKVNLNNGLSDPTLLREKLYLDFLWQKQISAPRANFARVYLNGAYWGLYTLVEHVDKTFMQQRFGQKSGNLFKAQVAPLVYKGEDQAAYAADFELKTNEAQNDWSDLIHFMWLLADIRTTGKEIDQQFFLTPYLRAWAANNLFVNTDSYLGSASNYYLYQDVHDGRFRHIIWDVNLALGARNGAADLDVWYLPENRPLNARLLADPDTRKAYHDTLYAYLSSGFLPEQLFPQIDSLWQLIESDFLVDTLKMYSNDDVLSALDFDVGNTPGLKPFILERRAWLLTQTGLAEADRVETVAGLQIHSYPNPFNDQCRIDFRLPVAGPVQLALFDVRGSKVRAVFSGSRSAGRHWIRFQADALASGLYWLHLRQGALSRVRKILLIR